MQPTRHNPELHEVLLGEFDKFPAGHLLDVPSGPGYLMRDLQGKGFTGKAAEIDSTLHVFSDVDYVSLDMSQQFPFPDASFDYVASIEGIEHIENHFNFLREVARVLKPGGRLLLTTPNILTLESRLQFFLCGFHEAAPKPIAVDTPNIYFEHINLITLPQLYFCGERCGLRVERVASYRRKKGSLLLAPLFPFFWLATVIACFGKEKSRSWRKRNRTLFRFLLSPSVLLGANLVVTLKKPSPPASIHDGFPLLS